MDKWHFDKSISISLIIVAFLQFAGFIWFASKLDSRVTSLELKIVKVEDLPGDLKVTNVKLDGMQRILNKVEDFVDKQP